MTAIEPVRVFFGYPSTPESRRETIADAAALIGASDAVIALTWEDLPTPGRLAIDEILRVVDGSGVCVFDVTNLNQNVLFELGYAIGRRIPVWLTRDGTDEVSARSWKRFGLLRSVHHQRYNNSSDIVAAFETTRAWEAKGTLFEDLIAPSLVETGPISLFYFKNLHDTNASRALSRSIEDVLAGRTLVVADPDEGSQLALSWYAQQLFSTRSAIVHFTSPGRYDADVHNARCALVAGLARGMGKPLLMLAENDYSAPFDYQDLLHVYRNAKDCEKAARDWLAGAITAPSARTGVPTSRATAMATDLKGLRLGSHIAEDERDTLAGYFLETRAYTELLAGATALFIGRKGIGKTASFLRAAEQLGEDKRNLVCAIKPPAYDLDGVLSMIASYSRHEQQGYLVEALWKYLLFSEIARSAAAEIRTASVPPAPGTPEALVLEMADDPSGMLHEEFAVRLERAVRELLDADHAEGIEDGRRSISEALHDGALRDLRELLGKVLSGRKRIAILVDNLDKGWERGADLTTMSHFLLGLLGAVRPVAAEFAKADRWRKPVQVSLAVFLRADIYSVLLNTVRERDKLPVQELQWADSEVLLRVVEERYAANKNWSVDGSEVWDRYFTATVEGDATRSWIAQSILPRPRDLVYLCNAAITNAVNRGHGLVEDFDLQDALDDYSHFALDSIVVEGEAVLPGIEDLLYEFAGTQAVHTVDSICDHVKSIPALEHRVDEVIEYLTRVAFIGPEVAHERFEFLVNLDDRKRLDALARHHLRTAGGSQRYLVHRAFWRYLELGAGQDER